MRRAALWPGAVGGGLGVLAAIFVFFQAALLAEDAHVAGRYLGSAFRFL
jgi:predicted anti-sigma-YlaC factor YlaD